MRRRRLRQQRRNELGHDSLKSTRLRHLQLAVQLLQMVPSQQMRGRSRRTWRLNLGAVSGCLLQWPVRLQEKRW